MRRVSHSLPILRDDAQPQGQQHEKKFSGTSGDRAPSTKPI
ncbi:hypothetical protein QT978_02885 [Microcoleus sp. SVA1_B3]